MQTWLTGYGVKPSSVGLLEQRELSSSVTMRRRLLLLSRLRRLLRLLIGLVVFGLGSIGLQVTWARSLVPARDWTGFLGSRPISGKRTVVRTIEGRVSQR